MDLDQEWKQKVAARQLQEEGQKEEKKFLLKLSSKWSNLRVWIKVSIFSKF